MKPFREHPGSLIVSLPHLKQPSVCGVQQVLADPQTEPKFYVFLQTAEMEVVGQQRQMDYVNSRGKQLLQDVHTLPQFDPAPLREDLQTINNDWKNTTKVQWSSSPQGHRQRSSPFPLGDTDSGQVLPSMEKVTLSQLNRYYS